MSKFTELKCDNDLKEIIQSAFSTTLDISGSWGYSQELSTVIHSCTSSIEQFEHIFASIRAYTEMSMTQVKEDRYGSINVTELSREQLKVDTLTYDKVTYKVTAMKEDIYANFINEYKENYGKETFDLSGHFKAREKATLTREVTHWFEIHHVI